MGSVCVACHGGFKGVLQMKTKVLQCRKCGLLVHGTQRCLRLVPESCAPGSLPSGAHHRESFFGAA